MERINTEIMEVIVEIDGEEFAVAPKTVAVADQLHDVAKKHLGKPQYRLWMAELEVLLGRDAVKQLFHSGANENIDRLQRIHAGVVAAFDANSNALEAEQAERKADDMAALARNLAPLNELLKHLQRMQPAENANVIRRP